ncbi:MAG: GNAT family protein [Burkholderiaceae bacterium]
MAAASLLQPPERLEGEGVRLRRSAPQDAPAMFRAAHDPEVMRYMDWPLQMAQGEAWAFLDAAPQRWRDALEFHWMIEPAAGAEPVGCLSCRPKGHAVDLGIFLARDAWGHGWATGALKLLLAWLMQRPAVWRITASVDVDNERAAAMCERAGLRREGLMRCATVRPNLGREPRDAWLYALARSDF